LSCTPTPSRYLPMFALRAVFPLPNTSHDPPNRGVKSLYAFTPSVAGITICVGRKRDGPSRCSGNQLVDRSKRSAACTVTRLRVYCSCTKNACQPARALLIQGEIDSVMRLGTPLLSWKVMFCVFVLQVRSSVMYVP